ncbi:MAG: hypothetical protein V2I56_13230 [Desulfobacteraceae bacterium]|nr:hypothetical protein [Desulfobacteraceae bacterium]
MGAELDKTEKAFFIFDKPELNLGAVASGIPNFSNGLSPGLPQKVAAKDATANTWLVCRHLSQAQQVYNYCLASGLITIVLGKCFCETCYDNILQTGDLAELIGSGRPMTDRQFADNIITPIIASNDEFARKAASSRSDTNMPNTWVSCAHLANRDGLRKVYAGGGQIYIFEDYFICQDCFNKIPADSLVDLIYEGQLMTDALFYKRIIEYLYEINYESLQAVGHFNFAPAF